jgi:hypothetical protein
MRRQYHFHKSDAHTLIWDVHKLVELSKSLPVVSVPLSQIRELDERFWFNGSKAQPTCREIAAHAKLIMETDLNFPIILSSTGRVMDGMHRACKAWTQGAGSIKAVRFPVDPEPDYIDVPEDELPYD